MPQIAEWKVQQIQKNGRANRGGGREVSAYTWQSGLDALFKAAATNNVEACASLLRGGVDINSQNAHNMTALMVACEHGARDVVEFLVRHGARLFVQNAEHLDALMIASAENQTEIVSILLQNGASAGGREKYGWTPLMLACAEDAWESVSQLIRAGADVNARNDEGQTALEIAIANDARRSFMLLIWQGGADVNVPVGKNGTALTFAMKRKNRFCTYQLIKAGARVADGSPIPFPRETHQYGRGEALRTDTIDARMVALKNSSLDALRKQNVRAYIRAAAARICALAKDDYEKVKMVHDLITLTVAYDHEWEDAYEQFEETYTLFDGYGRQLKDKQAKDAWTDFKKKWPSQEGEHVLQAGKGVCEGIACAFQVFCDILHIPCDTYYGYANDPKDEWKIYQANHVWNAVSIYGVTYYIDCTWDMDDYTTEWLFVRPGVFAYTHFSDESNRRDYDVFVRYPYLKPSFFSAVTSFSYVEHFNACKDGKFALSYTVKDGARLYFKVFNQNDECLPYFTKDFGTSTTAFFSFPDTKEYLIAIFYTLPQFDKPKLCGHFYVCPSGESPVRYPWLDYQAYGIEGDGILLSPIIGPLVRGKEYTFSVRTRHTDVELWVDGEDIPLRKGPGGIFSLVYTIPPEAGVIGLRLGDGGTLSTFAAYEVTAGTCP